MDTKQLAAFCAVVERKSFSQAAERMGVTQPAVSLQIRALERRLGRQLLDRSGRRVEPTEAGRRLYRSAQRMLALEELREEPLILMQEGGGVRQLLEDELRRSGHRLRDFDVHLELGLQESVRSAVLAGYGLTFISRSAVDAELSAGAVGEAGVRGLNLVRDVSLVRATRRSATRAAEAFVAFAKERLA